MMVASRYYWLGILTLVSLFALSSALAGPLHDASWHRLHCGSGPYPLH